MGLVEDYRMGCYFLPVILVQKNNPREIESLKDLTQPGIRLALGNAKSCAIGRRTKRLFEKNDISMEEVTPNVVMECMTVNELGSEVKLGMVDAAIVWDAVAAHFQNTCEIVHIPPEKNVISKVAVASLSGSRYPEIAEEFLEFVGSQKGRGIFKKHHFTVTLGEETADLLDASEKTGAEEPNSETPAPDASDGESGEKNASLEAPNSQQE
jgi:molybdate transport system substrate-binding protein